VSPFSENRCLLAAAALFVIATGSSVEKTGCLRALDDATSSTEKALLVFESKSGGDVTRAREVLAAADAARTRLESSKVGAFCDPSRSEELIYLNHLTLGFTGWIAARSRRPPAEYDVTSVIRRARTHRSRGRARLR
jgi:hypothetical protein